MSTKHRRPLTEKQQRVQSFIEHHFGSKDTLRSEIELLLDGSHGPRAYDFAIEAVRNKNIALPPRIISALAQVHGLGLCDVSGYFLKLPRVDQKEWNEFIEQTVASIRPT